MATITLAEKDIFLVERAPRVNKFDKGVHTVEFKVPVNQGGGLGVEGGVGGRAA